MHYLNNEVQRSFLTWGLLVTTFLQTSGILFQSLRGVSSFFKQNTPFDDLIFNLQIVNYFVFFILMVVITYLLYFQKKNTESQHFTWGIRLGLVIFLIGLSIGFYMMLVYGNFESIKDSFILNKKHGNLIIPFFLGIHGLQIIPLLSYYIFQNKRQVVNFAWLYFIMMVVFLFMAFINLKIF
ncbi:MAG: hypothetical protein NT127_07410 [Sphingobacteriales bacterium]|nr:hypothetical protein [Sphingobacteriales bacterium]